MLFIVVGGILGFGVSYVYSQFGPYCGILCNRTIAASYGALIGLVMSFDRPRSENAK
jgi:hypothetical protein